MHTVAYRLFGTNRFEFEFESLSAPEADAAAADVPSWTVQQRLEAAYDIAESAGDVEAMALIVLEQAGLRVHEQRSTAGDVMLSRLHQLARLVDPRSSLGLRIRTRLAAESDYRSGGHAAIVAMVTETTQVSDPAAKALALNLAGHCLAAPGGPERAALRRELASELMAVSVRTERRTDLLMGLLWQAVDHFIDGDRQAERRLGELKEALRHYEHPGIAYLVGAIEVMLAIRAGDLARAETQAQSCHRAGSAVGDLDATAHFIAHLAAIRWYQCRIGQLQPMVSEAAHSPTLRVVDNAPYGLLAVAAAANGDRLTAADMLAALRGRDLSDLPRSCTWLVTMYAIAEAAYLLEDAEPAEQVYELLGPYAELPAMAGLSVMCLGSVQHVLGVAAMTTGRLDLAVEHLQAAIRDNQVLQHRPALVMSRVRYAQALTRRDGPDDLTAARQTMTIAQQEAEHLGLPLPEYGDRQPETPSAATCARVGQQWRLRYGGRDLLVRNSVGISYLTVLLANPGRDIPAAELAAGLAAVRSAGASAQPLLDRTAIQQYRRRIAELTDQVDEFQSRARSDRAEAATAERDWLLGELASATGLAQRARMFTSEQENARLAVSKAIRRTITSVTRADPSIGGHLTRSIKTGTQCSYRPF